MTTEKSYGKFLFEREQKLALANNEKEQERKRKIEEKMKINRDKRLKLCDEIRNHLLKEIENDSSNPRFIVYYLKENDDFEWVKNCYHDPRGVRDSEIWHNFVRLMLKDELEVKVSKISYATTVVQAYPITKFYL